MLIVVGCVCLVAGIVVGFAVGYFIPAPKRVVYENEYFRVRTINNDPRFGDSPKGTLVISPMPGVKYWVVDDDLDFSEETYIEPIVPDSEVDAEGPQLAEAE